VLKEGSPRGTIGIAIQTHRTEEYGVVICSCSRHTVLFEHGQMKRTKIEGLVAPNNTGLCEIITTTRPTKVRHLVIGIHNYNRRLSFEL